MSGSRSHLRNQFFKQFVDEKAIVAAFVFAYNEAGMNDERLLGSFATLSYAFKNRNVTFESPDKLLDDFTVYSGIMRHPKVWEFAELAESAYRALVDDSARDPFNTSSDDDEEDEEDVEELSKC